MKNIVGEIATENLRKEFWKSIEGLEILDIPENLRTDIPALAKAHPELKGCIVELKIAEMFFSTASILPSEVREAGMCDAVVFEGKKHWLRCFLRESIKDLLVRRAPILDTHAYFYVTGSGVLSRLSVVVAAGLGFRKINWVASDETATLAAISDLKKLFFDLEITFIRDNELTLQPSNGSLLINTMDKESGSALLEDLSFLNFLQEKSVVVNLPLLNTVSNLLHEAEGLSIIGIDGVDIWGLRDYFFLKALIGKDLKISEDEYLKNWKAFIMKSAPAPGNPDGISAGNQDQGPVTKAPTES